MNLNDFCAELHKAGAQASNAVLADLPDGSVLLFNDAALRTTNGCCWGQNFAEVTNLASAWWFFASSAGALQDDARMRTSNRDYSYQTGGGLFIVNVEVTTKFYGGLVIDLNGSTGPVITNHAALPWGRAGAPYDLQLRVTGGPPPFTLSTPACPLPPWLVLETDGRLHGTPTTNGVYCFVAQIQDAAGNTKSQRLRLFVTPPTLPELRFVPNPAAGQSGFDVQRTLGSQWRFEQSTNLQTWVRAESLPSIGLYPGNTNLVGFINSRLHATNPPIFIRGVWIPW